MNSLKSFLAWHLLDTYVPEIEQSIRAGIKPFEPKLPAAYLELAASSGYEKAWNDYFTDRYSSDRSVLVLSLSGPMTREPYYNWGNDFYIRLLRAAAKDESYKGAVMQVNTPGGTCDSLPAFAQAVADFSKSKPIVFQTAGMYSAGYYIGSQGDEIFIEDQAASGIGSIGTLAILENYAEYYQKNGMDMRIMRATGSQDKALLNSFEPFPQPALDQLQGVLDACQREFVGAVKRGRGGKITSNEVFTGNTYGADQAIKLGLADKKGDLNAAIKRVLQLAA
ncbi:S49 family peptidase [Dyadobacter sp.]|uniref:S49 family peptidase n=1 Tax=Dyadobacter sp. TaxID=1914288 RepID=UPI003F71C1DF